MSKLTVLSCLVGAAVACAPCHLSAGGGGGVSLTDSSTAGWTYDATAKTISDGDWVLGVSAETDKKRAPNGLLITSLVSQSEDATVLDFTKSVTDAAGGEFIVVSVGYKALKDNAKLAELYLPEGFYSFGEEAFCGCKSLTKVSPLFPNSLESIASRALADAPLEGDPRFGFGEKEISFGEYSFRGNKFTTLTFGPNCNKRFSNYAFPDCSSLKQVTMDDSVTAIGEGAFRNCQSLTNITPCLPKGLTSIGARAFQMIPSCRGTLEICTGDVSYSLSDGCFSGSGFDEIVFGKNFSGKISNHAVFEKMQNLRRIRVLGDANFDFAWTQSWNIAFDDNPYGMIVEVPNPADNASWKAVLEDPEQVIPWADLEDETKAKFRENFPNERNPKGLIIANWSSTGAEGPRKTLVNRWITYENKAGFVIRLR